MTEVGMALSQKYLPLVMRQPGTVGEPLPGVEVLLTPVPVAAAEDGQEQASNTSTAASKAENDEVVYHLGLRGPALFDRYWANPQATKESVVTETKVNKNKNTTRYFDTGDTVGVSLRRLTSSSSARKASPNSVQDEAATPFYRILGRTSVDILKCRGYKLSALEIEAALLLDATLIDEIAVVGSEHPSLGEQIVAVVKPAGSWTEAQESDLVEKLKVAAKGVLAPYKCPTKYVMAWEGIPRNAMGKVNKKSMKKTFQL